MGKLDDGRSVRCFSPPRADTLLDSVRQPFIRGTRGLDRVGLKADNCLLIGVRVPRLATGRPALTWRLGVACASDLVLLIGVERILGDDLEAGAHTQAGCYLMRCTGVVQALGVSPTVDVLDGSTVSCVVVEAHHLDRNLFGHGVWLAGRGVQRVVRKLVGDWLVVLAHEAQVPLHQGSTRYTMVGVPRLVGSRQERRFDTPQLSIGRIVEARHHSLASHQPQVEAAAAPHAGDHGMEYRVEVRVKV